MNQILLTENQNNNKKNKNQYGKKNNNSPDMKRIIIFFGIAILMFAILIIGIYGYKMSKGKKGEKEQVQKPQLSLEQTDNQVKIIAESNIGIDRIIYSWNDEEEEEFEKNGITNLEQALEIPEGTNTLKVKVIDLNGEEIETSQEFYIEEDKEKPKIEIDESIGNGKVKIIGTDQNNGIKFIRYKWNDEEEVEMAATAEGQSSIETIIDVKRGKNTLKVTAINKNDKENTVEKIFNGVNKPIIEVVKDGNQLFMKITHDMGFKKIEFTVNGNKYIYDENFAGYKEDQKEVEYKFELISGENTVIVHAVSTEETEETYKGKCTYTAE